MTLVRKSKFPSAMLRSSWYTFFFINVPVSQHSSATVTVLGHRPDVPSNEQIAAAVTEAAP